LGVAAEVVPDVGRAVDRALSRAGEGDAVLVTGSLYVVGAARTHLGLR
jgi:folylpolyglutamate synthase/dihydropteroate synthase